METNIMAEIILGEKWGCRAHQAGRRWMGRVNVVLFNGPKASFSG